MAKRKPPVRKTARPATRAATPARSKAKRTAGRTAAAAKPAAPKRTSAAGRKKSRKTAAPAATRRAPATPAKSAAPRKAATRPKARTLARAAKPAASPAKTATRRPPTPAKATVRSQAAAVARKPAARSARPRRDEVLDRDTPETPNSFNLDVRRTRNSTTAIEELVYSDDPDSDAALVAGDMDVDADTASAVGDEIPGGDNPTPDMDAADLIGRSLGVEYEDTEELQGAEKIAARDRKRWELDPASAEDYKVRNRA